MCGIVLVIGCALLGATWLIMKNDKLLNSRAYNRAWPLTFAMAGVMVIVSLWTSFLNPKYTLRWFSIPSIYYVSIVPLLTVGLFVGLIFSLSAKKDNVPFILALVLLCCNQLLSAIPPIAIRFSEVKPVQAKVIIDAENTHKANILVCRLVGFWCAKPCHYRLGDEICFVTEKQSADGAASTRPRFVVAYFQNEILAIRGR